MTNKPEKVKPAKSPSPKTASPKTAGKNPGKAVKAPKAAAKNPGKAVKTPKKAVKTQKSAELTDYERQIELLKQKFNIQELIPIETPFNHIIPQFQPFNIQAESIKSLYVPLEKADSNISFYRPWEKEIEKFFTDNPDKIRQTVKVIDFVNDKFSNITRSINSLLERFDLLKNNVKVKEVSDSLLSDFIESKDLNVLLNIFGKIEEENQRTKIFKAICDNYNSRLSDIIINALQDKNASIRALAARSLEKLDRIHTENFLIQILNDSEFSVTVEAELLLGKIDDINTLLKLYGNVKNKNQSSRFTIFQKLCDRYMAQFSQIILLGLNDENNKIRALAVKTLERLDNINSFDLLLFALKDKELNVRTEAAIALGKLKDIRALDPLLLAFEKERYSDINRNILCSLISLGHKPDISAYIKDLNDASHEKRVNAASLIIEIAKCDFSLVRNQWNNLVATIEKPNIDRREGPSQSWYSDCGGHSDQSVHRDSPGIGINIPAELKKTI